MNFLNFLTRLKGWFDTRYSLRKALFWSFVSVIFVPMLLVGSIVAYASINDSRQSAESKLEAVSSLKEAAITRWTEGMMGRLTESGTLDIAARTLYEFDRRPAFVEHLVSRFRLDIMAIRGNSADFDVISLMDLSGNVKASTNLDEVGKTYRDRPFFAYGKSAPYIQPIFYDSQTQAAVLYLSTPVTASTGEVVGVLAGKANLSVLQAILQETTGLGRGSETYLATQDRLILTPVLERRDRVRLSVGMQEGFRGHAGARLYTNYAGAPVVGAYRPLPGLGAVLLAEQGQQYAFAALRRAAALLFVLSLLIVSGAMVLGYVLTNRIVTPIRSLTDVAADIAGGNLNQSITLNRQDEVGRLAAAFNNMAGQVQTLVNTLEDRVARRTRALQTSAEVARNITGILELEQLLAQVANLIQERFGYYFVQVLLADDEGFLVTRAGSGELGEPMAARGYRVKLGTQTPIGQAGLGRPQIINDVYRSPGWEYNPLLPDTKAELALPLQRRTSTLGVLNVHSNRKDAFSSEDITVLQSIANQLVIAVRNARLFHESEAARRQAEQLLAELDQTSHDLARRSAQLQTAIRVSTAAGTILEPQTLLQEAVNLIKEQFNFYYAGLFLVDEAGDWAVLKAGTGQAGQQQLAENHRLKLDDTSMVGWSITHRQARIAGDVERDTVRFVNPNLPHTRSEMALPLVSHNQVLGAITVQSERENAFSDQDISVLQTVADQIAAALQNSRLFSQVQAIQARFEDLYHRAPAGYHTLAVDGTILEINNTELNLLGRRDERENIVNRRNITDFMTAESTTRFNKALRQLQAGERVDNLELTYVCRDGTTRPVLTTAAPERDNNGRITEIYASVQDISRQKQAEAARRWLVQEMETLYHLGRQLLTAETLPQIYQAGIDAIKTTNPGRGVAVLMYNQAPNKITLELAALWDNPAQTWPPVPAGSTFSAVELGLQEILQTGQTITAAGEAIAATFAQPLCQLLAALQIESLAGTPLWRGGAVIGFVLVGHHTSTPFTDDEIRLFESVARQMSVSIDNYYHLQQAIHRATQLEAAAEVAKNTTSEVDLSRLLPLVVELIHNIFEYYYISILLVDEYRQYAVLQAASGETGQQLLAQAYKLPIDANSYVGTTIIEGRATVSIDVHNDPRFHDHPLLPDTRSELTLPLTARGDVIGVLDVQSAKAGDFQSGEVVVLQTMADQLANAIYVARLFEKERAAAHEIRKLHHRYLEEEWSNYLQVEKNLEKTTFVHLSEARPGQAGQADLASWFPQIAATAGRNPSPARYPLTPAESDDADAAAAQSALVSPLTLRDIPIGALGLIDDASREWTDDDLAIIEAVSAQAALAVENARLIEETRRWVLQLQTSAEISQSITATLNLDTLISSSVNLVRFKFNFAAVYLYLIDDSSPNRRILLYRSDAGGGQSAVPVRVALYRNSLTQQALLKAQTLVAQKNNPALHALLPDDPPHIKSALAIPLSVRQKSLGTLEMYSPQNNAFEQDNVAVLELLASQIATSISNALAYQEQQDIAEKLREVDRLKTQFLANMSHELRTPLNSIIGFSRVILKGIDGPLTELQKTDLTSIHQSGKHLLDLINNILDLSKIEAGKLELSFEPVNLKTLIGGITSTAIGLVKDKGLEIIELVPDELPLVEMDETRIRQVLLNLISNAAKFTQQGRITIKVRCDDNRVKISVSDTGIGIAPADQQTIFDEFTQIDASTTRKAGGTGLGLPISRKFVELHRGQIQVESRLNAGSTFTVELPISQSGTNGAQAKPARPPLPAPAPHPRSTLLVVDSDPRIVSYYQQYLQGEAVTIKHLGRGEEALAAAKKLQPKAIMLDVLLPDADGWTILGALKENPHTAHIPVIICSIIEDRYRATKLGAADYLVKPVIKRDLLHMLQKLDTQKQHPNRVLVIDDQAEDILLIRRILEAHDCQVVEARNGLEGLDIIFSNPPDLVMLDLTMPGLDGFGVLESLKSNPKTGNIPVVVITAKELTAAERKTVDRQADALLQKGKFTDSDLLRHVNRFFERVAI